VATDRQIDRLVYGLYDLTDDEIGIVEEATEEPVTRSNSAGVIHREHR
jgi:hypothetical protein